MPLTITALLPHSPLLIPEIGRSNLAFLAKTNEAYNQISKKLKDSNTETLIIISPHGPSGNDSFIINVAPEMVIDFKDFGYISPKIQFQGDAFLADQIQRDLRPEFSLQLISEGVLDSGSAVPLYLFKELNPGLKVIIISPATDSEFSEQLLFGEKIYDVINKTDKNIAVIASGDLSHRLKKKSPGGYSPKGAKFDNRLIEYLSAPETAAENILKMDKKLILDAGECGLKPIIILLGLLKNIIWQPEILAYQTDFGIGYLSLEFKSNEKI